MASKSSTAPGFVGTGTVPTKPVLHLATLQNGLQQLESAVKEIDTTYCQQLRNLQEQQKRMEMELAGKLKSCKDDYDQKCHELNEMARTMKEKQAEKMQELAVNQQQLQYEMDDLKVEKQQLQVSQDIIDHIVDQQNPVTLEVGGEKFRTQTATLVKYTDSIFPKLVKALQERTPDKNNRTIFIDRDSKHFKFILNYIRQGPSVMKGTTLNSEDVNEYFLTEIIDEIRYYRLPELEQLVKWKQIGRRPSTDLPTLVRGLYLTAQIPTQMQRKVQPFKYKNTGKDWKKGENLTGVVFESVLFTNVSFEWCVLTKATFKACAFRGLTGFKNANLDSTTFEQCQGIESFHGVERKNAVFKQTQEK